MASDDMRVRLHLRQVRVLAVVVDTPSELVVEVESTLRRLRLLAASLYGGVISNQAADLGFFSGPHASVRGLTRIYDSG